MLAIIGGTGLYKIEGLENAERMEVPTPFGMPSAPIAVGNLGGKKVAFLARHGLNHQFLPSEVNYRANIWALKSLGATTVIGVSAVGSLQKEVEPGHFALPDQYLDFTRGKRDGTFFGGGLVAHLSTAQPTCTRLADSIVNQGRARDLRLHPRATYACVEGPRLGNRAESQPYRGLGCHLVGMTNVPEVYLAREAQLCYTTIGVVTDYDCWLDDPTQHATTETVIARYMEGLAKVNQLLKHLSENHQEAPTCACRSSLRGAVLTPPTALSSEKRALLELLQK